MSLFPWRSVYVSTLTRTSSPQIVYSGTESCFPLCSNAVNAGSKHLFAYASGPQWDVLGPIVTNLAVLQMFMKNSVNSSLAHRQAVCNLPGGYSTILPHKGVHCSNWFLSDGHMCLTWSWHVCCTHTSMMKITTPSENCSTWHTLSPIHSLHSTVNVGSTNFFCQQIWITARRPCLEESVARSLTVISLLSATHCRYGAYTKFLLTYTATYWRNHKVLPLGITAFQPQSHFPLGMPYTLSRFCLCATCFSFIWQ